ncbi:hypothetical protein RV11_GL001058 [Enterococcus phoeniculicola]|nr:hypothetical protein RV11_GL001058 [Enterococcus phoeniculicola]
MKIEKEETFAQYILTANIHLPLSKEDVFFPWNGLKNK